MVHPPYFGPPGRTGEVCPVVIINQSVRYQGKARRERGRCGVGNRVRKERCVEFVGKEGEISE